jgi:hypothetical protein
MIGFMPAVGELVRCTDGSWMARPPQSCPHGHRLRRDNGQGEIQYED